MLVDANQFGEALKAALAIADDSALREAAGSGISKSYYVEVEGRAFPLKTILRLAYRREGLGWDGPHSAKVARLLRPSFKILHITRKTEKERLERQRENAQRWERDPRFRTDVLDLYSSTCVISGCTALDAIDAAHLLGVGEAGEDKPENGIVLRADLHRLFDAKPAQMAIDPSDMTVHFSGGCRAHFVAFDAKVIKLPKGGPTPHAFAAHWRAFMDSAASQLIEPA